MKKSILMFALISVFVTAQEDSQEFDLMPDYLFASLGSSGTEGMRGEEKGDDDVFEFGLGSSINENLSLESSFLSLSSDAYDTSIFNIGLLGKARVNETFAFYGGFGLGFWSSEFDGYKEEVEFDREMTPEERAEYDRYLDMEREQTGFELDGQDIYMRFGLDVTINENFSVFLDFYSLDEAINTESNMLGFSYNF